jgi:hypothetical protein
MLMSHRITRQMRDNVAAKLAAGSLLTIGGVALLFAQQPVSGVIGVISASYGLPVIIINIRQLVISGKNYMSKGWQVNILEMTVVDSQTLE